MGQGVKGKGIPLLHDSRHPEKGSAKNPDLHYKKGVRFVVGNESAETLVATPLEGDRVVIK